MLIKRKTIRRYMRFYGEVQAVGFRYTAITAANDCGATGWVKNEADGSVSMEIQGTEKQISRVTAALKNDGYIRIERTVEKPLEPISGERGFRVKF